MSVNSLAHLNLRGWPFSVVPSPESSRVWVGRPDALIRARRLVRSAARVESATLVLLWASFGAGKTHLLQHIAYLAEGAHGLSPIYVAVPQGARSFIDIYQTVINAMVSSGVLDSLGELDQRTDVERALARIRLGSVEQRRSAVAWLHGDRTTIRELRDIGVSRRIESTADAVDTLTEIGAVLAGRMQRLLLLIDEIQELAEMSTKNLADAVGGLHKLFDRSPGLTLVLSFTTAAQQNMKAILGPALSDRASDLITLPALTSLEAEAFITDLMREWSIDSSRAPFPFEIKAVSAVVEAVATIRSDLTPRMLIKQFNRILRQADIDIEDGEISVIDRDYALANRGDELE